MTIFLRDLPNKIQLNPHDSLQFAKIFGTHPCQTILFQWQLTIFDKDGYLGGATCYTNPGSSVGDNLNLMDVHLKYITNSFGLLLVSSFFNATYKKYPQLALKSIKEAYAFNYNLEYLFIIQALNRLSYANFGLDYEKYRNYENIKSRSIIEDFHSILGQILTMPEKTEENENIVWREMPSIYLDYQNCLYPYKEEFISYNDYVNFVTKIYHFVLENKNLLSPFFSKAKVKINSSFGEFRALRNANDNSTYLYKSWLAQPEICEYQDVEIEKMKIKNKFNYKEIGIKYNPYSKWEDEEKKDLEKMGMNRDTQENSWDYDIKKSNNPLRHIPDLNLLRLSKNSNNINSENLSFYTYPEELTEIWKNTGKKIYSYQKECKFPENEIFKLEYEKIDENELLEIIERKKNESINYMFKMHIWAREPEKIEIRKELDLESEEYFREKILLEREIEACLYITEMIKYFANLGEKKSLDYL